MPVDCYAQRFQPLLKSVGHGLTPVVGDDHAAHEKPDAPKSVDKAQRVVVVGDAQIAPALGALYVVGGDGDDDLGHILHFQQHTYLAVRMKARQHTGGVKVVEQLSAEFQIQLAAEFVYAIPYVLGLQLNVLLVVKAQCVHTFSPYPIILVPVILRIPPAGQDTGRPKDTYGCSSFFPSAADSCARPG